jgi:PAS domain S-box-containing protein
LIFVKDREGRYIMANPALCRALGRNLQDIIGKTDREILSDPTDAAIIMDNDRRIMSAGKVEVIEETAALPGGERIYLSTKSPYVDEHGAIVGLIGIATEITDRKRYERELFDLNQTLERRVDERTADLERSNRELDQFAYVASHDLKAPLRAIEHLATWIAEDAKDVLPAASLTHLEKLRGRVKRMEKLLADLLTYSRAGRMRHTPTLVDTGVLVRDIVDTLAPPPGFTLTVEEPMPTLHTEQVPLELVLRNLIANAIKHHDRQDGHIRVAARQENGVIAFTISDDGPGIPPQFHQRIFEMFQTLQPKDQVESSGMGLAIVKKVVESAGGAVTVASAPGEGASFTFTWPK